MRMSLGRFLVPVMTYWEYIITEVDARLTAETEMDLLELGSRAAR